MNPEQVTEFLTRVVQPRLPTLEGVGEAEILGGRDFAMRVWIDPMRLAARGVTAADVLAAIRATNFLVGARQDRERVRRLRASRCRRRCRRRKPSARCRSAPNGDQVVRLRDVAKVELGAEEHRHDRQLQRPARAPSSASSPTPVGQPARPSPRRCTKAIAGDPADPAAGHDDRARLRRDRTSSRASIEEVFKTIAEAVAHRRRRDPALPRLVPLGADADRHDPAVADRRLLRPLRARLSRSTC